MESLRRSLSSISGGLLEESKDGEVEEFLCQANSNITKSIPSLYGNNQNGNNQYEDLDSLEMGRSKELFKSSLLTACNPRGQKLLKTHVVREDKKNFYMYDDSTNGFLLSAKMVGNNVYISQYENFPANFRKESDNIGGEGRSFIAVLRLCPRSKKFKLFSRKCECCDDVLGLMTCGAHSLYNGDRQLLLELEHSSSPVHCGYDTVIDCNVVMTKIPNVYSDLSRSCWCARFGKAGSKSKSMPFGEGNAPSSEKHNSQTIVIGKNGRSKSLLSKAESQASDRDEAVRSQQQKSLKKRAETAPARITGDAAADTELAAGNDEQGNCALNTRKPRFDRNSGSLRMKFLNNRVKEASSKNLIFCIDKNSHVAQQRQDEKGSKSVPLDDAVLQFGKASDNRFNLDYRFPLAPVQAFAMCVSLFKWQAGNDK